MITTSLNLAHPPFPDFHGLMGCDVSDYFGDHYDDTNYLADLARGSGFLDGDGCKSQSPFARSNYLGVPQKL